MQKQEYHEYLRSPEWRAYRATELRRARYRCETCGAHEQDVQLHVHHLTYRRVGREEVGDTEVLCENCHLHAHGRLLLAELENKMRQQGLL